MKKLIKTNRWEGGKLWPEGGGRGSKMYGVLQALL